MKRIKKTGSIKWAFKRGGGVREHLPWKLERSGMTAWKRGKEMHYLGPDGTPLVLPILQGFEQISLIPLSEWLEGSE
jgi:hypothetical protein